MVAAEESESFREAARRQGFVQGHDEGLEAGRAEGYAAGFTQGYDAGHQEGMQHAESDVAMLAEAARQWRTADESIAAFLERAVVQLSLDVARQVIRKEVSTQTAEELKARLTEITQTLRLTNISVAWALHPEQVATLAKQLSDLPAEWTLHADEHMAMGGVRVRTQWPDTFDGGRMIVQEWDARIETRWSEVVARILDGD